MAFYGAKAPRAKKTARAQPVFEQCVWLGLKRGDRVKKPFAFKYEKGRVVVVGFHDD